MTKEYKPTKPDKEIILEDRDYMIYEMFRLILNELRKARTK